MSNAFYFLRSRNVPRIDTDPVRETHCLRDPSTLAIDPVSRHAPQPRPPAEIPMMEPAPIIQNAFRVVSEPSGPVITVNPAEFFGTRDQALVPPPQPIRLVDYDSSDAASLPDLSDAESIVAITVYSSEDCDSDSDMTLDDEFYNVHPLARIYNHRPPTPPRTPTPPPIAPAQPLPQPNFQLQWLPVPGCIALINPLDPTTTIPLYFNLWSPTNLPQYPGMNGHH
ncbi:hypothetical protein HDU93_001508 [Gonapodya sp. JEL0774]|nr:hypothetical protein HDU93_001508 [Gonapodya sp. JEL0774]